MKKTFQILQGTSLSALAIASSVVWSGRADDTALEIPRPQAVVVESTKSLSAPPPPLPNVTFVTAPPPPSLPPLTLPTGENLVGGSATVSRPEPGRMHIDQSTDRAAINWKGFDVGREAKVHISQPNSNSVLLNRVEGRKLSEIAGTIEANGKFILVNPNGIIFYEGSKINVNGILASTQDLDPKRFMESQKLQLNFDKPLFDEAGIVVENGAEIRIADSGMAYFVSPFVRNEGTIIAKSGQVKLLGAPEVSVDFYGDSLINFILTGQLEKGQLENKGILDIGGGHVVMSIHTAKDIIQEAVNLGGVIKGSSLTKEGGKVFIEAGVSNVTVSGDVQVLGETLGGHVVVLTKGDIEVESSAKIDASGQTGGGKVHLGAVDFLQERRLRQKEDPELQVASNVKLQEGSVLKADALKSGNGGEIIAFSIGDTTSKTTMTARGKEEGGTIEVSGEQTVSVFGHPDPSNEAKTSGLLITDPGSITISHSGSDSFNGVTATDTWINTQLETSHVFLSTSNGTTGDTDERITINSDALINWTTDYSLALEGKAFTINGSISHQNGDGHLTLRVKPSTADLSSGRLWGRSSMVDINSSARIDFSSGDYGSGSNFGLFRIFSQDASSDANTSGATLAWGNIHNYTGASVDFPIYYKVIGASGANMGETITALHDAFSANDNIALGQDINFNMSGSQGYDAGSPSYTWSPPGWNGHFSGDNLQGNMYTIKNSTVRFLGDISYEGFSILDHVSLKNFDVPYDNSSTFGAFAISLSGNKGDNQSLVLGANLDHISVDGGSSWAVGAFIGRGEFAYKNVRGTNLTVTSSRQHPYVGGLDGYRYSGTSLIDKNVYTTGSILLTRDFSSGEWASIGGISGYLRSQDNISVDTSNLFSSVSITFTSSISNFDSTSVGGLFGVYQGQSLHNATGLPDNAYSSGDIVIDGTTYGISQGGSNVGQSFGHLYWNDAEDSGQDVQYRIDGTGNGLDGRRSTSLTNTGMAAIDANYMFAGFSVSDPTPPAPPPAAAHHTAVSDPGNISNFIGTASVTSNTGEHSFTPAAIDSFVLPTHETIFSGSEERPGTTSVSSQGSQSAGKERRIRNRRKI